MDLNHWQKVRILYKLIFKLHRGLPADLRVLGNSYVRDEFQRHKNCNPAETAQFMLEWTNYVLTLSKQMSVKENEGFGKNLNKNDINSLSDDQTQQLYELMLASKNIEDKDKPV